MRLFQTLALFAILAYAVAGPYYGEEYDRYQNKENSASKYQKNSRKSDTDKSLDRGIEIGRNGLNLKNKKYDTDKQRSRDLLATEDDNEETDYTKYRKPAYAAASPYDDDDEYERYQNKENYPSKYQKPKKYDSEKPRYRTSPAKEDDNDEADYPKYRKPTYDDARPYDEEYQRYKNKKNDASKYQKNSKKFDSDKSLDRGIEIGRNGLNLKNKKYNTEKSRSKDLLSTKDKNEETDYTKYRKPTYGGYEPKSAYASKPYNKKPRYNGQAPAAAPSAAPASAPASAPAAAAAKDELGGDGVLIENGNDNKNFNSEKSKQHNAANSENANGQRQEKSKKKLNYKERTNKYNDKYRHRN